MSGVFAFLILVKMMAITPAAKAGLRKIGGFLIMNFFESKLAFHAV
jgi:hypothetical protein